MKKFWAKATKVILKVGVPVCSMVVGFCIFVANSSPNMCVPIWAYEVDMPESIKDRC